MPTPRLGIILLAAATISIGALELNARPQSGQSPQDTQNNGSAASPQDQPAQLRDSRQEKDPQNSQNAGQPITLPVGYVIPVRVADDVDSKHGKLGEMFSGTVDPSVLINDIVVIPRGTEAHIRMVHKEKGGHIHGKAAVTLELVSLIMNGQRLEVDSDARTKKKGPLEAKSAAVAKKGESSGGVFAGDPGAAAGPVIAAFSAAKVEVKAGSRIEFKLESPFTFEKPPINATQP